MVLGWLPVGASPSSGPSGCPQHFRVASKWLPAFSLETRLPFGGRGSPSRRGPLGRTPCLWAPAPPRYSAGRPATGGSAPPLRRTARTGSAHAATAHGDGDPGSSAIAS